MCKFQNLIGIHFQKDVFEYIVIIVLWRDFNLWLNDKILDLSKF